MFLYLSLEYQGEGAKYGLYAVVPSQFYKTDRFHFTQIATNMVLGRSQDISVPTIFRMMGPRVLLIGQNILTGLLRLGWQKIAHKKHAERPLMHLCVECKIRIKVERQEIYALICARHPFKGGVVNKLRPLVQIFFYFSHTRTLDRFTKTFFWNFQNSRADLCYILIYKTSQELRMLSRSLSDCKSLLLNECHGSSFAICQ